MSRASAPFCRHCHHAECQACGRKDPRLELEAQYTDKKHDIDLSLNIQSLPTTTINQITEDVLHFLFLDDIPPEQVRLVGIDRDGRHRQWKSQDRQITLEELDLTDGCILFFEPTPNASPPNLCQLTIVGPDEVAKVDFGWYRAKTTLGMLLEFVIETFSLESLERERIHLFTIFHELEIYSHSDSRLSEFGLHDRMSVYVQIIPPLPPKIDDENKNVHVKCTSGKRKLNFDIPNTQSIGDLKAKIEEELKNREVTEWELYSESNDAINLSDPSRTLRSFGIRPDQTICAEFNSITRGTKVPLVNSRSETSTKTISLLDTKPKFANVTVTCNFPSNNSETFEIPVTHTVSQLIEKVDSHKNTQRLDISKMYSETITIDFKKDNWRCLADLGFKRDDKINVDLVDKPPVHTSIVSKKHVKLVKPEEKPKNTRPKNFPIGLDNLGNSCYMNSALQCLAHVPTFNVYFMQNFKYAHMKDGEHTDKDHNPFDAVGDVIGAYAYLLWNLIKCDEMGSDHTSFKPNRIKETIGSKDIRFATDDQQDVQEFMTYILDAMHEELKAKNNGENNTIINELFFGGLKSTITCTECQKEESTIQPISFLSIPLNRQEKRFWINFIPKAGKEKLELIEMPLDARVENIVDEFSRLLNQHQLFYNILVLVSGAEVDMKASLSELFTDEFVFLEQEDKLRNDRPARLKMPEKRLTLNDCLTEFFSTEVLQDGWNCSQSKCRKKTTATKQLSLSTLPNVLIIQFKRFSHENGMHLKIETFVDYPVQGLDLKKSLPRLQEPALYDLCAVSNHMGWVYGGHYTACARHIKGNTAEWYTFDDASVSRINADDYPWGIVSRHAYLLFYVKRGIQTTV